MIKKIIRYSLLVMTLLGMFAWAWSYFYAAELEHYSISEPFHPASVNRDETFFQMVSQRHNELAIINGSMMLFSEGRVELDLDGSKRGNGNEPGLHFTPMRSDRNWFPEKWYPNAFQLAGLTYWHDTNARDPEITVTLLIIPMWLVCLFLVMLTVWCWYRPIRDWREKRTMVGFEVEMKEGKTE